MLPLWRTTPVVVGAPPPWNERVALRGAGGAVVAAGLTEDGELDLGPERARERRLARLAAKVRKRAPAVVVVGDTALWNATAALDFGDAKRVLVLESFEAGDTGALEAAKAAGEVWVRAGSAAKALASALGAKGAKKLLPLAAAVEGGAPVGYEAGGVVAVVMDGGADDEAGLATAQAIVERLAGEGLPVSLSIIPADAHPAVVERMAEDAAIILAPFNSPAYRSGLLLALAMGRPLVASPGAVDGLAFEGGEPALLGDTPEKLADHVIALLADPDRAAALGAALAVAVRAEHDIDTIRALLVSTKGEVAEDPLAMAGTNASPTLREGELFFNPISRLFTATGWVRCAAPSSAITGCFQVDGVENLANAWVQTTAQDDGWSFFSADAVLPPDVSIGQLAVVIEAFRIPVLTLRFPDSVTREEAGFLSLELDNATLSVDAWTTDPNLKLQAGTRMLAPEVTPVVEVQPDDESRDVYAWMEEGEAALAGAVRLRASSPWPLARKSVKAISEEAKGQNFSRIDDWFGADTPTSLRMQRMKDRHLGQTAWLIGNGPSVRVEDIDRLGGQITFGFNRFYLSHDITSLRPTYTVTGDRQMMEDFGQEIVDVSGGEVFVAHDEPPPLIGDYIWLRQLTVFPPLISKEPARAVTPGGSSLFVAMQLAYYMGIRKLYVYGADFHFNFVRNPRARDTYRAVSGDGNHFIKNYRSGKAWCPPSFRNIATAFLASRMLMESEGGFIRNATRGGALEIFPREDFESALAASSSVASESYREAS